MNVLIACECSGVVRNAFRKKGHNAWSNDIQPADDNSRYHLKGDCLEYIGEARWDLIIAHPPCTFLAVSGARWFKTRPEKQIAALALVASILNAPCKKYVWRIQLV